MRQKILLVGRRSRLARFDPLLDRTSVESIHLPAAEPALAVARELAVDLVIAALPPLEMSRSEFLRRVREPDSASRKAQLLVLKDEAEPAPEDSNPATEVVDLDGGEPAEDVVSRFLRRWPRAETRLLARIEVALAAGSVRRLLQVQNLSLGGVLLRTAEELPLGSAASFELPLHGDEPVRGMATVARRTGTLEDRPAGVALRFTSFEGDGARRLGAYLERIFET